MSDFLEQIKSEIQARISELQEAVDEHARLQQALDSLNGNASAKAGGSSAQSRRGRPRGTSKRASEAIEVVSKQPGLTTGEIAEQLGINQNYLYRVLPTLQAEGKIEKQGRGWHPVRQTA